MPDRQNLEKVAQDCPQIEFLPPQPAMKEISACTIYVLASRTEGMGRVLLEAMAAARPIIASNVGGVSHYISDNDNGLLFTSGSVEEVAEKMERLLSDKTLRTRLGRRGYEQVFSKFDEAAYVRAFKRMLQSVQNPIS
jgi:glycosyltransferase involved in cell wall biosynthesis